MKCSSFCLFKWGCSLGRATPSISRTETLKKTQKSVLSPSSSLSKAVWEGDFIWRHPPASRSIEWCPLLKVISSLSDALAPVTHIGWIKKELDDGSKGKSLWYQPSARLHVLGLSALEMGRRGDWRGELNNHLRRSVEDTESCAEEKIVDDILFGKFS